MTVYRRRNEPGHPWYYDFWLGRVRYQGYCRDPETDETARTEREAEDIQGSIRRSKKISQGIARSGIRPGAFSLGQAMALHLANQVDSTEEHRSNLAMYSREILAFFKPETPVTKIPLARVQAYRKFCAEQPIRIWIGGGGKTSRKKDRRDPKFWKEGDRLRSPASVNHYLDCLRGAFTQAHEAKHPVTGMPMLPFPPKVEPLDAPKRKPTPMADTELEKRKAEAMPWVRDGADLARYFGLRMDEAARVTIHHVDDQDRCLGPSPTGYCTSRSPGACLSRRGRRSGSATRSTACWRNSSKGSGDQDHSGTSFRDSAGRARPIWPSPPRKNPCISRPSERAHGFGS